MSRRENAVVMGSAFGPRSRCKESGWKNLLWGGFRTSKARLYIRGMGAYARCPSPVPPISGTGNECFFFFFFFFGGGGLYVCFFCFFLQNAPGFLGKSSRGKTPQKYPLSRENTRNTHAASHASWGGGGVRPGAPNAVMSCK